MTDRTQFEAMLEALINEDQEKAKDIFHNIVVAKSREIYEELLAEDFDLNEKHEEEEEEEEEMDESSEEEGEEEGEGEEEEEGEGEEDDVGGDAGDDFVDDTAGDEGDGDLEDRVMDLEDALDELKAEFEQLMADEEGEGHDMDGMDDMGGDDMGGDMDLEMDEDDAEIADMDPTMMAEYVNKVQLPKHGDNGVNTKSTVAGKNDMGGTAKNIAQGFSTTTGGTKGGLLKPSTQLQDGGNINKPGANAGKTAFKKKEPGHGPEKKGTGEKADNKKSLISSKVR